MRVAPCMLAPRGPKVHGATDVFRATYSQPGVYIYIIIYTHISLSLYDYGDGDDDDDDDGDDDDDDDNLYETVIQWLKRGFIFAIVSRLSLGWPRNRRGLLGCTSLMRNMAGFNNRWYITFNMDSTDFTMLLIPLGCPVIDYSWASLRRCDLLALCVHLLDGCSTRHCEDLDRIEGIISWRCFHCSLCMALHCTDSERPIG